MSAVPNNIFKAMQPQSPFLAEDDEAPVEINIGDPSDPIDTEVEVEMDKEPGFDANLAEYMDESDLTSLVSDLLDDFENDKNARKDWETTYIDGLDLLGLKIEERSEPWQGACGVYHPMLTEAAIRFQSEMISETFPAQGPVKAKIIGKDDPDTQKAAKRVVEDMNYQLTEKMVEFRPEHEKMLWSLALAGASFKKVYFDPSMNRQVSMFVPAEDLYIPYGASDARTAERLTHVMRKTKNDIKKLQYAEFYRDIDLGEPSKDLDDVQQRKDESSGYKATYDNRYKLLEMQVELDLAGFEDMDDDTEEETGIALPYIVTIESSTQEILSIRRNWDEHDPLKQAKQHFVQYTYIPGFGAYGYGLIHLIGGFAKSATSIVRQLIDAGTLSNLPGGLKSRGLRIKGDDTPIMPGEWRDVDVPSANIKDNILPLPYKEPSATLFQLLQNVVEEGRRLAAVADVKLENMNGEAPVGTTLAILERTLKVMSAVQARVHASMEQEFKLIAALVRDYTAPAYDYLPDFDAPATAKKEDYDKVDIIPVSDPNASTMAQRIIQYQAAIQLAQQSPQIYNLPVLHRQMLEVMGIKDADKIVIVEDDQVPTDPVTENVNILKAKPVKAFMEQDQDAHLAVHQSMLDDPKIAAAMGQNPQASVIKQALMAHIMEHVGFQYRRGIETQLGTTLPPEDAKLSPEMEIQLAKLSADAAKQLIQANQAEQAQKTAQQQAQDPVVMMQQKELQLKQQELNDKKEIELKKIDASKEIAMLNNEAKLMVQGEDAKVQGLFKGLDIATQQINAQNAMQAAPQVAPQQASPQGAPPAPAPQQPPSMPPAPPQPQPMG
ncbi:hypothetical protein UFOVP1043_83 [uncultured Caudovirales phage]|uniref:Portal protein n=1 Tax=uncultured Caudovirales phage TaxID=2100421 RepID=A0A6J5QM92_9CAUD|nr:hypothetical protein UFOVP1043_83 [uncultured Caudovirales phage]